MYNINNFIDPVVDTSLVIRDINGIVTRTLEVKNIVSSYTNNTALMVKYNSGETEPIRLQFSNVGESLAALVTFQAQVDIARNNIKKSETENNFICKSYVEFVQMALAGTLTGQAWYLVLDTTNVLGLGAGNYKTYTTSSQFIEAIFENETDGRLYKVFLDTNGIINLDGTKQFVFNNASIWVVNHNLNRYDLPLIMNTNGDIIFTKIQFTSANSMNIIFSEPTSGTVYFN